MLTKVAARPVLTKEAVGRALLALRTGPTLRTSAQLADVSGTLAGSDVAALLRGGRESFRYLRLVSCRQGRVLCRQGEPADALYFTAAGSPQAWSPRETGAPGVRLETNKQIGSLVAAVGDEGDFQGSAGRSALPRRGRDGV